MKIEEINSQVYPVSESGNKGTGGKDSPIGRVSQSDGKSPKVNALNELKETSQSTGAGKDADLTNEEITRVAEGINKFLEFNNIQLDIQLNKDRQSTTIRVLNASTGETIRTIPISEFKDLSRKINSFVGVMFNQKV